MKIVDVMNYSENGGGIRTYIQAKMRIAEKHGHEVVVVAPGPEDGEEEKYGGRIVWVKGPPVPFYDAYSIMWNMRAVHQYWARNPISGRARSGPVASLLHVGRAIVGAH